MGFVFRPTYKACFLLLLGLVIFIRLGLWQWHRAEDKQHLLDVASAASAKPAVLSSANQPSLSAFQAVTAQGHYIQDKIILLDNRFYQHRVGYEVLVPFRTDDGQMVLVNLGWLAATPNRAILPKVPLLKGKAELAGHIYYPSSKAWTLGQNINNHGQWPLVIEQIDFQQLQQATDLNLAPFILRLDENQPNALVREWPVVTMTPAKHRGYALQWFCFAFVAVIIFIVLNTERTHAS